MDLGFEGQKRTWILASCKTYRKRADVPGRKTREQLVGRIFTILHSRPNFDCNGDLAQRSVHALQNLP